MLYVFLGTDRKKTREAMNASIEAAGKKRERVRITDAHSLTDLEAALQGGGMFSKERLVIFDGSFVNAEMREKVIEEFPALKSSADLFYILEEKFDAATKRSAAKYAQKIEIFDAAKKGKDNAIFRMRFALEKGDRKALWVSLMSEYAAGKPAEAVHGFLFWAAKQIYLGARGEKQKERGEKLLISLTELPHEARRRGFDLEYALERFVLSSVVVP